MFTFIWTVQQVFVVVKTLSKVRRYLGGLAPKRTDFVKANIEHGFASRIQTHGANSVHVHCLLAASLSGER